jgi:hypothetical protein
MIDLGRVTTPEKKEFPTTSPARQLTDLRVPITSVNTRLLGLSGPYLRHAIGTFNTCLRGIIHRSLTDTGGGYNLRGTDFSHHTPRPSQLTVLHFPPKGSARSQVIQSQHSLK